MRTFLRVTGTVLAGAGLLAVAWALTVWQWQDPFTALYTTRQQQTLERAYERQESAYRPRVRPEAPRRQQQRSVLRAAEKFRAHLRTGDAVGRLHVPRLNLSVIVVNGTDKASLAKGPGRYERSYVPGEGELIYVAGHRTTYGAPFAHIDRLERGDLVTVDVPYGRFVYRVTHRVIVPADDVQRLVSTGREEIALQACHPRFFATQRYIVYARPVSVTPRGGTKYPVRGKA
jgi:sortase A